MADEVSVEEVADMMFKMIKDATGQRKLKPTDISKAMREHYGDRCSRATCKKAIRILIDSARCEYTYFGSSYIEIPKEKDEAEDEE